MNPPNNQWSATTIEGAYIYTPSVASDCRGIFLKTYNKDLFAGIGIAFDLKEEFFSISHKNVIRGMHFQSPPSAHAKLISCLRGRVIDVMLDLRSGNSYGKTFAIDLVASNHQVVYIPKGIAHGFLSMEDNTCMHYKTSWVYSEKDDCGVRYDSFGFDWPVGNPVLSRRDLSFGHFDDLITPFVQ